VAFVVISPPPPATPHCMTAVVEVRWSPFVAVDHIDQAAEDWRQDDLTAFGPYSLTS